MKVIDDQWYGYEKLSLKLQVYAPNVQTLMPATTLNGLEKQLNRIGEDGQYFIPLNINCLSQKFEEGRNNHWAGLYVVKSFGQVTGEIYIDPMGKKIDGEISAITRTLLNIDSIGEPLLDNPVQYVQLDSSGTFIEEGNDDDCGSFLVYCITSIVSGKKIRQDIKTPEQAISFGQYLREAFSREENFNEIHQTITSCSKKDSTDQGGITTTTTTIIETSDTNISDTFILENEQELNKSVNALEKKLFSEWHLGIEHTASNPEEEKNKILLKIQIAYETGLKAYQEGNLELAEQEFVKVLKPVLSKPSVKNLYVNVEEVKGTVLDAMYHLGLVYLHEQETKYSEHHAKAAAIFHYCAEFAQKHEMGNTGTFLNEAFAVETKFLSSIGKIDIESDPSVTTAEKITAYKKELKQVRGKVKKQLEDIKDLTIEQIAERTKAIEDIYHYCTTSFVSHQAEGNGANNGTSGLVQKLIADCHRQLGGVPTGCEYAIIGLGSLAGGKMTPYSDLEFAILINEDIEEHKEYFRKLTKLLHIKVINFGETMLRGVGIEALNNFQIGQTKDDWFWDSTIMKSGFSFDGAHPHACKSPLGRQGYNGLGNFELILTPNQLAEFQKEESWFKSDKHLVQALKSVCLISGSNESQEILDQYRNLEHNATEVTVWQFRALEILQEDLNKFKLTFDPDEEGKLLDAKRDIYRLGDRIIEALANYYDIMAPKGEPLLSTWATIDKMRHNEILSEEGAQHLKEALSIATELRLRTYCHNDGQQSEAMSTYTPVTTNNLTETQKQKLLKETFHIKGTDFLKHFYHVMMNLQALVTMFCSDELHERGKMIMADDKLFNSEYVQGITVHIQGLVCAKFLEYDNAVQHLEIAKAINPDDKELLMSLLLLYVKTGQIDKASCIAKDLIDLVENENDLANYFITYGAVCLEHGSYDQGIEILLEALKIKREISKEANDLARPDIAAIYTNLGQAYCNTGMYNKALEYSTGAIRILAQCKEEHPSKLARSYDCLGSVYMEKEEYDHAEHCYSLALKIKLESCKLHLNHSDIANSYHSLGNLYFQKGNNDLALRYCLDALNIRLKIYESIPDNPDIATSYVSLANLHGRVGEYDQARSYFELALNIKLKVHGSNPNHPDIATVYNNLGYIYQQEGNYYDAIKCYDLALSIRLSAYSSIGTHPEVASSYCSLGHVYMKVKEYQEATHYYDLAMEANFNPLESNFNRFQIAEIYNDLGRVHLLKNQHDRSIYYYNLSLETFGTVEENKEHSLIALNYNCLGMSYFSKRQFDKALHYYQLSLDTNLQLHQPNSDHVDIAIDYRQLGVVYSILTAGTIQDQELYYKKAQVYYEEAFRILTSSNLQPSMYHDFELINSWVQNEMIDLNESYQEFLDFKNEEKKLLIKKEKLLLLEIMNDNPNMLLTLISEGCGKINKGSPLHTAYSYGSINCINVILSQKNSFEALDSKNIEGKTPLHCLLASEGVSEERKLQIIQDENLRNFHDFTVCDSQGKSVWGYVQEQCSEELQAVIFSLYPDLILEESSNNNSNHNEDKSMKQPQDKIKFATWNIDTGLKIEANYAEAFEGWRMKNRIEKIAKFIERVDPDILHVQEVRKVQYKEELINSVDPLKIFLETKGYKVSLRSYDPSKGNSFEDNNLTEGAFKYITAYKTEEFEALGTDWLPVAKRCVFITKLRHIKTEEDVYTFNVHMDHESEANRMEGSKLIVQSVQDYVLENPKLKIIIAGDFNSFPDTNGEGQIQILTDFTIFNRSLLNLTSKFLLPDQSKIPEGNSTFFYYPYDFEPKINPENLRPDELRSQVREKFASECKAKGGHLDHILVFNLEADNAPVLEVSPQFEPFPSDYTESTIKDYTVSNIDNGPAFLSDHQLIWVDLLLSGEIIETGS